jgi:hypothetical protein
VAAAVKSRAPTSEAAVNLVRFDKDAGVELVKDRRAVVIAVDRELVGARGAFGLGLLR